MKYLLCMCYVHCHPHIISLSMGTSVTTPDMHTHAMNDDMCSCIMLYSCIYRRKAIVPKLMRILSLSPSQVPGARRIRADSANPETMEAMQEAMKNGDSGTHGLDIRDDRSDIVDMS
jgi:hypothetical protein